jgi:acetoin:2,6-dichlorophenolindophenol oxidoreductase subunit beta
MSYKSELTHAMALLAENDRSIFVGQSVKFGGQAMFSTLVDVPMERRIEMPVAEDMQMGFCTGLAMQGFLPVCIYPRIDFMLLCLNQLVNHLDKMDNPPKVIIRTSVGAKKPMWAGPQHTNDFSVPFGMMLDKVQVRCIRKEDEVMPLYEWAIEHDGPVVLVEFTERY